MTAFTYELLFEHVRAYLAGNRALDLHVGGWSVNAIVIMQSGFPLAVTGQSNNNSFAGAIPDRPIGSSKRSG